MVNILNPMWKDPDAKQLCGIHSKQLSSNNVWPPVIFLLTSQSGASFVDLFLLFMFAFVILSCSFFQSCGKGLTSWPSCM